MKWLNAHNVQIVCFCFFIEYAWHLLLFNTYSLCHFIVFVILIILIVLCLCSCNSVRMSLNSIKGNLLTYLLTMLANVNLCDENWKVPAGSNECWNTGGKWRDSCSSAELNKALFTRGQIIRWPLLQFFKRGFESLDPYDLRPWMVWEL